MYESALEGLRQSLQTFCDRYHLTTLPPHAHQVIGAFLVYEGIFLLAAPLLSRWLLPNTYGCFARRTRLNWDARVVSFVQAVFVCHQALHVIWSDASRQHASRDERLWGYSPASGRVQAFAAGYFLWDVLICVQHLDVQGVSSLLHAIAALLVTVTGFRPFANFYGINFVLYELSTPFLNIHWVLDKLDMTGSTLQLVNGLLLILSFFGCRLVWGTYQTVQLSRDALFAYQVSVSDGCAGASGLGSAVDANATASGIAHAIGALCADDFPARLLAVYLVGNTILSLLNVYWFGLMVKALQKRFQPERAGKKTK